MVRSIGFALPGLGAGTYVRDPAVDAVFVARHPRASFLAQDGSGFRLAGDTVAVEQFGARGDGKVNDQPAIQAALDYAAAVGIRRVTLGQARYALWCPKRTAPWIVLSEDGYPILIRATVSLEAPTDAVLSFLGPTGGHPDTDVQWIRTRPESPEPDFVWRGGGIKLLGDSHPSPHPSIDNFRMSGITLQGNRTHDWKDASAPAKRRIPGERWDMSDKGLMVVDSFVGDLELRQCRILNFRGELLYFAGDGSVRSGRLIDVAAGGSNGDAFNPGSSCAWHLERCHFFEARQAIEGWGGPGSRIQARFSDCNSAGTFRGGFLSRRSGLGFSYPEPGPGPLPWSDLDLVIERCEIFRPGSFLRGRIRAIDTQVAIETGVWGAVSDVSLDIDYTLDRPGFHGSHPVKLYGPPTLHEPIGRSGLTRLPPRRCHLQVVIRRSEAARRAGRAPDAGLVWMGWIGADVTASIADCGTGARPPYRDGTKPGGYEPRITAAPCRVARN